GMARRMRASSGGSSHKGGGKPSRMGGMMGVRKSFFQQYFSSMRSDTQGGTGMGVKMPMEKGHIPLSEKQPLNPKGASARTASTKLRTLSMPRPFPTEIVPRAPSRVRPEHRPPAPASAFHEDSTCSPVVVEKVSDSRARGL